jgi:hypothetical protein
MRSTMPLLNDASHRQRTMALMAILRQLRRSKKSHQITYCPRLSFYLHHQHHPMVSILPNHPNRSMSSTFVLDSSMSDKSEDDDDDNDSSQSSFDDTCPICLDALDDATLFDPCFHRFCFNCALAWLRVTPTCPLCKSPPLSLIHHIVTPHDYSRLSLAQALLERSAQNRTTNVSPTVKRRRVQTNNINTSNVSTSSSTVAPMATRRAVYLHRRIVRPLQFDDQRATISDALQRQARLDNVAQNLSQHWSRIQPFAERDLRAITGATDVDLLLRAVKALVTAHNVRRTDDAQRYMQQFLTPEHAVTFFNELVAFAASSFNMVTYDRLVQYEASNDEKDTRTIKNEHVPIAVESASSSSSSSSPNSAANETVQLPKRSPFCTCNGAGTCNVCHEIVFLQSKLVEVDEQLVENAERLQELERRREERYKPKSKIEIESNDDNAN